MFDHMHCVWANVCGLACDLFMNLMLKMTEYESCCLNPLLPPISVFFLILHFATKVTGGKSAAVEQLKSELCMSRSASLSLRQCHRNKVSREETGRSCTCTDTNRYPLCRKTQTSLQQTGSGHRMQEKQYGLHFNFNIRTAVYF